MLIVTTIMENFQNEFICYLQLFRVQSSKPSLLLLIFFGFGEIKIWAIPGEWRYKV